MTGLLFILGLVVVSGLVAYAGDHLGRRIGKAKMMMFGLRPRYTSILVAIITGMIITAITISALAISSRNVRDMLFRIEQIRDDLETAQYNLKDASKQLADARQALDVAENDLDEMRSELESKDLDVRLKQELIDEKETELELLTTQMADLNEQMTQLNADLESSEEKLNSLQTQYDSLSAELIEKESLINERTYEISNLESERQRLNRQLGKLNSQIGDLEDEIDNLQAERDDYIIKNTLMREHGIYVLEGQIISEFVIDTDLSYEQIVDRIRKAKYDWDNISPDNVHANPMAELTINQYTDVIEDVWRYRDNFGDVRAVIRIIAAGHVFADEEVPVELKAERYLLVYEEGEIISRILFSTEDDVKTIRQGILEMLESLEQQALEQGMIFEGVKDAVTFDPTPVVETARKASYYAYDFYIKLVAKEDIYNIDYLSIAPDLPEYDNMKLVIEDIKPDDWWYTE
jgi:uncharacterized protein (DUF3084 family)